MILHYPGRPKLTFTSPGGGQRERWQWRWSGRYNAAACEDGGRNTSQRMQTFSRSWKMQGNRCYTEASRKEYSPGKHLDFSLVRPSWDFWPTDCRILSVCYGHHCLSVFCDSSDRRLIECRWTGMSRRGICQKHIATLRWSPLSFAQT